RIKHKGQRLGFDEIYYCGIYGVGSDGYLKLFNEKVSAVDVYFISKIERMQVNSVQNKCTLKTKFFAFYPGLIVFVIFFDKPMFPVPKKIEIINRIRIDARIGIAFSAISRD